MIHNRTTRPQRGFHGGRRSWLGSARSRCIAGSGIRICIATGLTYQPTVGRLDRIISRQSRLGEIVKSDTRPSSRERASQARHRILVERPHDDLVFEQAGAAVEPIAEIGDREAVFLDEGAKPCLVAPFVSTKRNVAMHVQLDVQPVLDDAQQRQCTQRQGDRDGALEQKSGAERYADRRDDPDRRRGRQAAHGEPFPDDDAGAEKSDACDDAWITRATLVSGAAGAEAQRLRDADEQRRGERHQRVGAQAGGAAVKAALQSHQAAGDKREQRAQQQVVLGHFAWPPVATS